MKLNIPDFLRWARRFHPNEPYNYSDPYHCPIAQHLRDEFLSKEKGLYVLNDHFCTCDFDENGWPINKQTYPIPRVLDLVIKKGVVQTYGALVERLEAFA